MSIHENVRNSLLTGLSENGPATLNALNDSLRLLAKWRSHIIQNTIVKECGTKVLSGPFQGLEFTAQSIEGCHISKLLGCYEQPISRYIEDAINKRYKTVVNVGCAEGYYAVGMSRAMPESKCLAFDVNPNAVKLCKDLALKNDVSDRITVSAHFSISDILNLDAGTTLILIDIEGAEDDLLSSANSLKFKGFDMIVESHEVAKQGLTNELTARYELTHRITKVEDNGQRELTDLPDWFFKLSHLDQLLSAWEWREGPTPWLIMEAKNS